MTFINIVAFSVLHATHLADHYNFNCWDDVLKLCNISGSAQIVVNYFTIFT